MLTLLESGEWTAGRLVFLHPSANTRCVSVAAGYERHLSETAAFERMEIETLLDAVAACTDLPWVGEFGQRYLGRA